MGIDTLIYTDKITRELADNIAILAILDKFGFSDLKESYQFYLRITSVSENKKNSLKKGF